MIQSVSLKARLALLVALIAAAGAMMVMIQRNQHTEATTGGAVTSSMTHSSVGPPWIYGRSDARFTIIEYADLECAYCREYFPRLRDWVQANPEVNLQWHHLPLAMHEPAATRGARLVECAGETGGPSAFWDMVGWIYENSLGNGAGLQDGARIPGMSSELQSCLSSNRPDTIVQAQADAAIREGIRATPALRLHDRNTGKTIILYGAIEGDALSSALDLLVSQSSALATPDSP